METIKSLTEQVAAATGSKNAQLVLKNARIVNIFTQSVEEGDIAIEEGRIVGIGTYDGVTESDLKGAYVCPGFLDGHIHIESSMTSPGEFERAVVPHGTIAVIKVWAGAIDDIRSRVCNNLYLIHVIRYLHSAGPLGCVADRFPKSAWKA